MEFRIQPTNKQSNGGKQLNTQQKYTVNMLIIVLH